MARTLVTMPRVWQVCLLVGVLSVGALPVFSQAGSGSGGDKLRVVPKDGKKPGGQAKPGTVPKTDVKPAPPGPGTLPTFGQAPPVPGGPPPGGQLPGGPPIDLTGAGGALTLDFRGSDIANVLKFFAMATNWQIVPDAGLTGPVTIISPQRLTIDQAFQVLQSTLEVRGYTGLFDKRGDTTILKIVPLDRAVTSTTLMREGTGLSTEDLKNQVVTQVIPIENVDASSLARELLPLISKGASIVGSAGTNALVITDLASNVKRLQELIVRLDKAASNNDLRRFALKQADATDVSQAINSLFRQVFSRGRGGGAQGQPQPGGMPPGMQPGMPPGMMPGGAGQDRGAIVSVADTRTNSVIVVASKENMKRVEDLIKELDDEMAGALQTKIVKMKYADAYDVADTVNQLLSDTAPSGSRGGRGGGASFQQRVFGFGGGGFGGMGGGGGQATASTDPFAKVVPNARTNSLIVTATEQRMKMIDDMVAQLDVEVPIETTTFVVPLKNAQAQDLATILSQAFGQSSGGGGMNMFGGFGFNPFGMQNNRNQRQNINRRQGNTGSGARGGGRAAPQAGSPPSGVSMNSDGSVHGTLTANGFVPDNGASDDNSGRQFFIPGGGFGGMFGRGQQSTPQYGRGRGGQVVNLLQFRNNVGVVAEPASNSLIITTTPDSMEELRKVIAQLDIIPSQVMIEVIIAEASLDATQKMGFQFDAKGVGRIFGADVNHGGSSNFPAGTAGTTAANISSPLIPGFQYGVQSANFSALVQGLNSDNRVKILSTPKVFTSNNQQATIDVVTQVPYTTGSYTGGLNVGSSLTYDFLDVGIQLDVTPRITSDGLVTIDVVAEASELLGFDTMQSSADSSGRTTSILAPRTARRTTDTSVSVRDGEVVVLGGLMRDSKNVRVNKIPLLGDIPLLGHLFRNTTTMADKTELMIFLVPHVVEGEAQSRKLSQDEATAIRKLIPDIGTKHPDLAGPKPEPKGGRPKPAANPDEGRPIVDPKP